jgi:hypothetical protein
MFKIQNPQRCHKRTNFSGIKRWKRNSIRRFRKSTVISKKIEERRFDLTTRSPRLRSIEHKKFTPKSKTSM